MKRFLLWLVGVRCCRRCSEPRDVRHYDRVSLCSECSRWLSFVLRAVV